MWTVAADSFYTGITMLSMSIASGIKQDVDVGFTSFTTIEAHAVADNADATSQLNAAVLRVKWTGFI